MKKLISTILIIATITTCIFAFAGCGTKDEFVIADASDLLVEDFGIAVTKSNTALLNAVNAVVDEWVENGKMAQYVEYYIELDYYYENLASKPVAPEGRVVSWDFGSATEAITVYTESGFAPFELKVNNEVGIVGVDIAIMSQVAVNLGKKIEIKDVAFDGIAEFVQNAENDAVGAAGISITKDRAEVLNFSSPYYQSELVILASEQRNLSSVADLKGLKVGVQEGTSGDFIISDAISAEGCVYEIEKEDGTIETITVKAPNAEVKQYKQYALALADLKAGRIDAILMDKLPAQSLLKKTA